MNNSTDSKLPGKSIRTLFCAGMLFLTLLVPGQFSPVQAAEAPHAVVLMYHRFDEGTLPSTNIRLDQLDAHIQELKSGGFTVWPLNRIVDHLKAGTVLPDRTIAITIDDAYASVFHKAWPQFQAAGFPFTVFVSTGQVGRSSNYLTWDQIRTMRNSGVLIGHHGAAHAHMAKASPLAVRADFKRANKAFKAGLGRLPEIFAYPYGEASNALQQLVKEQGFKAAFGQHSGVANAYDAPLYLPRFAMSETYGTMDRFKLAANALPIPVKDVSPSDMLVNDNPPAYGFTLALPVPGFKNLNCFASHIGASVRTEHLGPTRVEVRFKQPFPPGRSRINCTLRDADGRWRWLGRLFYLPKK